MTYGMPSPISIVLHAKEGLPDKGVDLAQISLCPIPFRCLIVLYLLCSNASSHLPFPTSSSGLRTTEPSPLPA